MKKLLVLILILITSFLPLTSQIIHSSEKKFTLDNYLEYFPASTSLSKYTPTTDYVCILPTNENNKDLQSTVNEFYRNQYINHFPTVPYQISRVISDKQALQEDLSNINIYAFGTVNGNLWISKFLEQTKDFPIKITADSIVAEKTFKSNNYIVTALWYNPGNFKHSVFLFVPQSLESYQGVKNFIQLPQYSIWQNGKQIFSYHSYIFKDNKWFFSPIRDTLLDLRDEKVQDLNRLEKIDPHYYRFPDQDQINTCKINNDDVTFDTVRIFDTNNDFSKLSDMEWLKPIAKNNKIIALGEMHHLKFNVYLLKRILFAINTFDYYPTLIWELPYSFTGYFNYYLTLADDNKANAYRDSVLIKIFKPGIPTIEAIRNWNKQHKDKLIQVGFSDLEHNVGVTIHLILNPYLKKIGSLPIPVIGNDGENIELYLKTGEKLIEQAKRQNIIGEFPFQTPEYMGNVFENFKTTVEIILDSKNNGDFTQRYQVMIHNLTDEKFLGKRIINGKTLFFGGFEHFRTLADSSNKKALTTEGYYLAHKFEATRGRVYSILMKTLAFSIEDSIQIIDPKLGFKIETDLIMLYKKKKIKINEPVLANDFSQVEKFILSVSNKLPNYSIRIQKINVDKILSKLEGFPRWREYYFDKGFQDFNTTIIIPFSPIGY
jgi:hypothetical protein